MLDETAQIEHDSSDRRELELQVREASRSADLIFIGRVLGVDQKAVSVDGKDGPRTVTRFLPTFEVVRLIKGSHPGYGLYWDKDSSSIVVSCFTADYFYVVDSLRPTFRYLVYAKDRRILSVSQVVDWKAGLSHDEELHLIEGAR